MSAVSESPGADRTLEDLLDRVRGLNGPDRDVDGAIALFEGWTLTKMPGDRHAYWRKPGVVDYYNRSTDGPPRYTGSLEAVADLCDRQMPDAVDLWSDALDGLMHGGWSASEPFWKQFALALLAALIEAMVEPSSPSLVG